MERTNKNILKVTTDQPIEKGEKTMKKFYEIKAQNVACEMDLIEASNEQEAIKLASEYLQETFEGLEKMYEVKETNSYFDNEKLLDSFKNMNYQDMEKLEKNNIYIVEDREFTELFLNRRCAEQVLIEKLCHSYQLSREAIDDCSIDLKYMSSGFNYRYVNLSKEELKNIKIRKATAQEKKQIDHALRFIRLVNNMSDYYYYMVETGNGFDEVTAGIYNACSLALFDKFYKEKFEKYILFLKQYINYKFYFERAEEDYKKVQARLADKTFQQAFKTIFDHSLHFNIDLELNYEKVGGIKEQKAIEIVESIGGYNNFNIDVFKKLLRYLNDNFTKYYGEGNPNNYQKDYTIKLGRESSMVLYIDLNVKDEEQGQKVLARLEKSFNADEITEEYSCGWGNNIHKQYRLWWD